MGEKAGGAASLASPVMDLLGGLFGSKAKPGQAPQIAPAQPAQVQHPLPGAQPPAQNPLTQYIMAITRMM